MNGRTSVFIWEIDAVYERHQIHVKPSDVSSDHVWVDVSHGESGFRMVFTKKGFIGFLDETKRMLEGKT